MKLPVLKPKEVIKILEKAGFERRRHTGSHLILRHPKTKRIVPVTVHPKDIKKGVLKNILKQADLSLKEFLELK